MEQPYLRVCISKPTLYAKAMSSLHGNLNNDSEKTREDAITRTCNMNLYETEKEGIALQFISQDLHITVSTKL